MSELDRRLKLIPQEDREDALAYYDEYIGDSGLDDCADVTALLGTPKVAANKIIAECSVKHAEEQKTTEKATKKAKGGATAIWLAILGVASLPISLPLAIVAVLLVLTVVIVAFVIVFSFGIAGIAVAGGGIVALVAAFFTAGIGQAIMTIGVAIAGVGAGFLLVIAALLLGKVAVKAIVAITSKKRA